MHKSLFVNNYVYTLIWGNTFLHKRAIQGMNVKGLATHVGHKITSEINRSWTLVTIIEQNRKRVKLKETFIAYGENLLKKLLSVLGHYSSNCARFFRYFTVLVPLLEMKIFCRRVLSTWDNEQC